MAIQSMTGYGRGDSAPYRVEIRGTNQKHLDIQLKAGQAFLAFEARIRERVRNFCSRGRLEIFVRHLGDAGFRVRVNEAVAVSVAGALRDLKGRLDLAGEVDVGTLGGIREIFVPEEEEADSEAFWPALETALGQFVKMREREGIVLARDILARISMIEDRFERISARRTEVRDELLKTLRARVQGMLAEIPLDEARLDQEVVFYADRSDITEELVRVGSHLEQFRRTLEKGGVAGKKLDFLCQEILRETNTVGSKASDSSIAHDVVDVKAELEKIREQLQNLE